MNAYKTLRKRIERMSTERKEFVTLEDGYYYFWPDKSLGALAPAELRILADILDERNKAWDTQVHKDLAKLEVNHDKLA